jgi:hypothetical protein
VVEEQEDTILRLCPGECGRESGCVERHCDKGDYEVKTSFENHHMTPPPLLHLLFGTLDRLVGISI